MSIKSTSIKIIAISGGLFLALTAFTAYITRFYITTYFNTESNRSYPLLKLNTITGGINWSHLQLGVGTTAIEIDTNMQHWGLSTYTQGQILDLKISSIPLATFSGKIHYLLLNTYFVLDANANELHHKSLPAFHATAVALKATGTVISNINQAPQLDTTINLTSDSNYGPLRCEVNAKISHHNLAAFWRNGNLHLRAILPTKLWELATQWNPFLTRSLIAKNILKQQADTVIIDVMMQNGNWQASHTSGLKRG